MVLDNNRELDIYEVNIKLSNGIYETFIRLLRKSSQYKVDSVSPGGGRVGGRVGGRAVGQLLADDPGGEGT